MLIGVLQRICPKALWILAPARFPAAAVTARLRGAEDLMALWMSWLGEAYLHVDRLTDACRVTSRALALARERKQRSMQALCHRLEAR